MGEPAAATADVTQLDPGVLRAMVEQATDGIFVADAEGLCIYANRAACRMLCYAREEILGRSIIDIVCATDVDRLTRARSGMLKGRTDAGEWTLRRKDGSLVPVQVTTASLPKGLWQACVRDISESRAQQAEREILREQIEMQSSWRQAVMDTLPLGVVLFEPGGAAAVNRHAQDLLGTQVSTDAAGALHLGRLWYPDGKPVPSGEDVGSRVMRGESILGEEYVARWPDGSQKPVLASAAPILGDDGRVIGGVGVFQDISERMRLEQAVEENARLLHGVFDLLPVGVWIADKSGRIVSNNPAAQRIWRGARHVPLTDYGEFRGWSVATGKQIAAEEWSLARALTHGETSMGELVRIQCFDDTFKTIINSAAPLRDDKGEIAGAIVVNEDITALYDIQEKLRASEHLFRTVFELLPVGLWIADADGRLTLGNPAAHRIWQGNRHVSPDQFGEYKGWWVKTGQPITADEWPLVRATRHGETSHRQLIRIQCFDGSFKTVLNWAAPIMSDSGEITGAVAVHEDVTTLHQTQEQLRLAVRDREDILAVVAHDLRNPLIGLMLVATSAERRARTLEGGEPLRTMAASIIDITRGMSALVDDLLAIAVARPGRSMLKITPVKADWLLGRAADAARPLFARQDIGLEVEVVGELPILPVDSARILRVFANLLDNALKFTTAPGRAVLRAEALSSGVRFCVANSGPALSAEELGAMFQPFWQAGREDRRGAGLGLAICRSIVEAHGGTIWAEPATGKRVRICFLLPSSHPGGTGEGAGTAPGGAGRA